MDWLLNRLQRAPDDGGGGGNDGDGGDGDGGPGEGSGTGGGGSSDQDGDGKGDQKVEMTQADLDALIVARAERASKSALATAAKAAGFDSAEAMTAAAKAEAERAEGEKSELAKAQDAKDAAERLAAETAKNLEAQIVANAFYVGATAAKIPADRLEDALALADLSDVEVKDGQAVGIDDAVATLVKGKPWIMGAGNSNGGGGADGGARGDGGTPGTLDAGVAEMADRLGVDKKAVAQAAAAVPNTPSNAAYIDQVKERLAAAAAARQAVRQPAAQQQQ